MTNLFKVIKRPKTLDDTFPPILVLDQEQKVFKPLTIYFEEELSRISNKSALSYVNVLLPFFSWLKQKSLYQGNRVKWDDSPLAIRESIRTYLLDYMFCKITPDNKGHYQFVKPTGNSPNSVKLFLAAIKSFYATMIRLNMYPYNNPCIDPFGKQHDIFYGSFREGRPRIPDIAGTEIPLHSYRRNTDAYFKLVDNEWTPTIIDDITLPFKILKGGRSVGWSLRDHLIARLLFETGARATEVVEITVGDYRNRTSVRELDTFSKGSLGKRIKFLSFSNETAILINRYLKTERLYFDKTNKRFEDLEDADPFFISKWGTPYKYHTWYQNWCKGCSAVNLKVNPHKTRHWYVTQALRTIYEASQTEGEVKRKLHELISYMKWRSTETIKTYEHYFDAKRHLQVQDAFFSKLAEQSRTYHTKQVNKAQRVQQNTNQALQPLERDIANFLNELE
jgi:hypothetical protein